MQYKSKKANGMTYKARQDKQTSQRTLKWVEEILVNDFVVIVSIKIRGWQSSHFIPAWFHTAFCWGREILLPTQRAMNTALAIRLHHLKQDQHTVERMSLLLPSEAAACTSSSNHLTHTAARRKGGKDSKGAIASRAVFSFFSQIQQMRDENN